MNDETEIVRLNEGGTQSAASTEPHVGPPTRAQHNSPNSGAIPGYEILEEIGRGGMGVVYKARQRSLNRVVALKVIIGGSFAGPTEKARFRMEAEALARLHHPNIVQVFDVGEYAGVAYIAFEFVDGPTVRRWQDGKPLEPRLAATLALAVARAVQHAHDMGIVHRDLKPANILLVEDRRQETGDRKTGESVGSSLTSDSCLLTPKVGDFGLAKSLDGGAGITLSGVACGTPNYMAPEQVRGGPAASRPPVDVWGVGAVLFELLTGRPPFAGQDASAIMQDITLLEPPSVRQFAPNVPRDLVVIVAKCLEKNSARRYVSPGEVASDLERFLAGQPILAAPVGSIERAGRWVVRNPMPTSLVTVLVMALLGVSAFAAALQKSAERERQAREGERVARQEEERLRKKADQAVVDAQEATRVARRAEDDSRGALKRTESALGEAKAEKKRAEENLALAGKAVRHVLSTAASLSERDDPALIPVYRNLLAGFEPFSAEIVAKKSTDRELRLDHAAIVRARGLLEALEGRPAVSREHLIHAVALVRELVKEEPDQPRYQFELAQTLGFAGSVSAEVRAADADSMLVEARTILEKYVEARPKEIAAMNELIRVRLSMNGFPGSNAYTDENDRAVLELVDRLAAIQGLTSHNQKTRAHALNNIASDLTNRGKTDKAEAIWLEVLALREGLYKAQPDDRITRYELGKCLANYANQLARTARAEQSFQARERAATAFDALREDARYRTTYIGVMINTNLLLEKEYVKREQFEKAINRLTCSIALNAYMLARDSQALPHRADHANFHTRRAGLAEQLGHHADAARDYKLASEYSTEPRHRDYCQAKYAHALVRSGNRSAGSAFAMKLKPENLAHPHPCVELARAWLAIAKSAAEDSALKSDDRRRAVDDALANARSCILVAQKKGWFQTPDDIQKFHGQKEFELIWDAFPRDR